MYTITILKNPQTNQLTFNLIDQSHPFYRNTIIAGFFKMDSDGLVSTTYVSRDKVSWCSSLYMLQESESEFNHDQGHASFLKQADRLPEILTKIPLKVVLGLMTKPMEGQRNIKQLMDSLAERVQQECEIMKKEQGAIQVKAASVI